MISALYAFVIFLPLSVQPPFPPDANLPVCGAQWAHASLNLLAFETIVTIFVKFLLLLIGDGFMMNFKHRMCFVII
jgi:hypothetical protein